MFIFSFTPVFWFDCIVTWFLLGWGVAKNQTLIGVYYNVFVRLLVFHAMRWHSAEQAEVRHTVRTLGGAAWFDLGFVSALKR